MTAVLSRMNDMPDTSDVTAYVNELGRRAATAARSLASASTERKNKALTAAAQALRDNRARLLEANAKDVDSVKAAGKPAAFIDRLILDEGRVNAIADALDQIATLPDPVGRVLHTTERPNGLTIERVATPLGVIGMIYESRPNVGADAGALCLKSGNAVILRGGSESLNSTRVIVECLAEGLKAADLPLECIQMIDTTDRNAVQALLTCAEYVDLVIPRGGKGLVSLVRDQARVPTLLHLDGNCHTYVNAAADLTKAAAIVKNAKLRRTGVCGATESLVVDRSIAKDFLPMALDALGECEVRGEADAREIDARIKPATDEDFYTEYLDTILSVKLVDGPDEAIPFISEHSSAHTDAVVTEDAAIAERFLNEIDSAVVMHNASTQFSDGGEFGMGAEIGIATGKMHARGPVGLEQLTSFKYRVRGNGQTRP
ncbi:glutamate-5-semialdehyde dehydrogenase [Oceanicaulis alexandrii]|uniref:glutamate-5-semialdehyde dehydrogenase n=1 Tax=Oceanicaulis alexandrii TaxID=153233 RepID=UPI0003B61904|nr:glutamate-5-semialdehyde dehydrogenase [Oceanicaulis alexandrii]VXC71356.1 Gamma-glutamyl phosphate reductase [Oceanicaulis sp. 350]